MGYSPYQLVNRISSLKSILSQVSEIYLNLFCTHVGSKKTWIWRETKITSLIVTVGIKATLWSQLTHCSHLDSSKSSSGSHLKSLSRHGKQLAFSFQIHLPYKCPPSFMHSFIHPSIIPSFIHRVPCAHEPKPRILKNIRICTFPWFEKVSILLINISALFWKHHVQAVSSPSSQKSPSSCHHLDHTHLGSPVGSVQWPTDSDACIGWLEVVFLVPCRELTYPTLGKGKSSSKCHFWRIC